MNEKQKWIIRSSPDVENNIEYLLKLPQINEALHKIKNFNNIPEKLFDIMIENLKKTNMNKIKDKINKINSKYINKIIKINANYKYLYNIHYFKIACKKKFIS